MNLGHLNLKYGLFIFHLGPTDGFGRMGTSCFEGSVCPLLFDMIKNCCALYMSPSIIYRIRLKIHSRLQYHILFRLSCLFVYWLLLISSFDSISNTDQASTRLHLLPFLSHSCWVRELYTLLAISFTRPFPLECHGALCHADNFLLSTTCRIDAVHLRSLSASLPSKTFFSVYIHP